MKRTFTKTLFLFFVAILLNSMNIKAQTACNYTFTHTVNGKTISFDNTPNLPPSLGNTIIWTINTTQFANTNDPIYTVQTGGIYIVCMTVIDLACPNSPIVFCDNVIITGGIGTAITETELAKSITVYPNPSIGNVHLTSPLAAIENISVFNAIGEMVYEDKKPGQKNELDLTMLSNGIYIIKAKTEAGSITKKIIINK